MKQMKHIAEHTSKSHLGCMHMVFSICKPKDNLTNIRQVGVHGRKSHADIQKTTFFRHRLCTFLFFFFCNQFVAILHTRQHILVLNFLAQLITLPSNNLTSTQLWLNGTNTSSNWNLLINWGCPYRMLQKHEVKVGKENTKCMISGKNFYFLFFHGL